MFKTVEKDFVKMDVARYGVEWFYIVTTDQPSERLYLKKFLKNLQKSAPATMIIHDKDRPGLICVYMYVFPSEETFHSFQAESQYEDCEL